MMMKIDSPSFQRGSGKSWTQIKPELYIKVFDKTKGCVSGVIIDNLLSRLMRKRIYQIF